jgi:antitoxin component of RelBE/YafQ-DinJ toxin-antitoxin module
MSSAIRVFLTQVVAQQALPFQVQAQSAAKLPDEQAFEFPLHVEVEVMLEQMAAITAKLFDLEHGETDTDKRGELAKVRQALQALRFQFDPYSRTEVQALVQRISHFADSLRAGHPN